MSFTVTEANTERNLAAGNFAVASIEIDITSYDASGGSGPEDVSGSALGLASDPFALLAIADENNYGFKWDRANQTLTVLEAGADGAEFDETANGTDVGLVQLVALYLG